MISSAFLDRKIWDRKILLFIFLSQIFLSISPAAEMPRVFFEQHCFDCHDATEKKGGLDLDALKTNFADAENFGRWVKVHDRIESGEMPPKKKERPPWRKKRRR